MKLNFKDYYQSKKKLLEAIDSSPKVRLKYKLDKYCKLPLHENVDSDKKIYYALKPDDVVEIIWEYDSPDNPTVRCIKILESGETYFPVWHSTKIFNWTLKNTNEI